MIDHSPPPLALPWPAEAAPTEKRPPDRLEQAIAILERMREELRGCYQEGEGGPINDPDGIAWIAEHDLLITAVRDARDALLAARTLVHRDATIVGCILQLTFLAYRARTSPSASSFPQATPTNGGSER